jgi:hypothetical protein
VEGKPAKELFQSAPVFDPVPAGETAWQVALAVIPLNSSTTMASNSGALEEVFDIISVSLWQSSDKATYTMIPTHNEPVNTR